MTSFVYFERVTKRMYANCIYCNKKIEVDTIRAVFLTGNCKSHLSCFLTRYAEGCIRWYTYGYEQMNHYYYILQGQFGLSKQDIDNIRAVAKL